MYSVDNELIDPREIMKKTHGGIAMKRRSSAEWNELIRDAILSRQTVNDWCRQHDIRKHLFYRHCRSLGYIADGKRTEKWKDCASEAIDSPGLEGSLLVPVPRETISAALVPPEKPVGNGRPAICIQNAGWRIFIGDGFSRETLRDVLEVIGDAQGS